MAAAVVLAAPSYGQYLYIDVNGDGLNSLNPAHNTPPGSIGEDVLLPGTYSIDLWYVTNESRDGGAYAGKRMVHRDPPWLSEHITGNRGRGQLPERAKAFSRQLHAPSSA